eukprot:11085350-Lingulodinium_polyedra.AAC.1
MAVLNAPWLAQRLGGCTCPGWHHKHVNLMTRGPDGERGTAPAKEYPAGLCQLLALTLHEACEARLRGARRLSP